MEAFKLIETAETAATANGWKFIFSLDQYENESRLAQTWGDGVNVLIMDVKYKPKYGTDYGGQITGVDYACIMRLGRKFDSDGKGASYDEYDREKFDRRLNDLASSLASFLGDLACNNGLTLEAGEIYLAKNLYGDNLDFAFSTGIKFSHEVTVTV